jgi:hypothetical protein
MTEKQMIAYLRVIVKEINPELEEAHRRYATSGNNLIGLIVAEVRRYKDEIKRLKRRLNDQVKYNERIAQMDINEYIAKRKLHESKMDINESRD